MVALFVGLEKGREQGPRGALGFRVEGSRVKG